MSKLHDDPVNDTPSPVVTNLARVEGEVGEIKDDIDELLEEWDQLVCRRPYPTRNSCAHKVAKTYHECSLKLQKIQRKVRLLRDAAHLGRGSVAVERQMVQGNAAALVADANARLKKSERDNSELRNERTHLQAKLLQQEEKLAHAEGALKAQEKAGSTPGLERAVERLERVAQRLQRKTR